MSNGQEVQKPNGGSVVDFSGGNTDCMTMVIHVKKTDAYFITSVLDDVKWELHRKGTPGKITFKVVRDDVLKMGYGDTVDVTWKGKQFFHGFVFEKHKTKEEIWSVTAYDQLRYLLNKDTFAYTNKTATQVIQELAEDFELKVGTLDDTKYVIPKHRDPNATILDMCQTALDLTMMQTGKMYVLYDDCGKLTLKELPKMQTDQFFDGDTATDYDYTGTIDKDTANLIKLDLDSGKDGHTVVYSPAKNEDYQKSPTRKQWGVLQYYESINPTGMTTAPQALADKLLELKNHVRRTFKLKGQAGDLSIRGGSMAYLNVNIGEDDMEAKSENQAYKVIVDNVVHKFENNEHTMDMDLIGQFLNGSDSSTSSGSNSSASASSGTAGTASGHASSDMGTGYSGSTQTNAQRVHEGLTQGADAWVGTTMKNGTKGCVEAAGDVGSWYSPFLAKESQNGVARVDDLCRDAGANYIDFDANKLEKGDIIVYDNQDHVVIYDGNGGYVGNSSSQDMVVNGSDYWEMDGMVPTGIIKTSHF